jgi:hypothetical protein
VPWYKFYATHGPGHQSETVFYRWYDEVLSSDLRNEFWQDEFRDREWPVGYVRRVPRLPRSVWYELVREFEGRLGRAQQILQILAETKTFVPRPTKRELSSRRIKRWLEKRDREFAKAAQK